MEASLTAQEKVLGTLQEVARGLTGDYVLEGIERLKVTGKVRILLGVCASPLPH